MKDNFYGKAYYKMAKRPKTRIPKTKSLHGKSTSEGGLSALITRTKFNHLTIVIIFLFVMMSYAS